VGNKKSPVAIVTGLAAIFVALTRLSLIPLYATRLMGVAAMGAESEFWIA
jgi:hypothetical protein